MGDFALWILIKLPIFDLHMLYLNKFAKKW